jgi:hypothetical protein
LLTTDTVKELVFMLIKTLISLLLTIKSYKPEKFFLIFEKQGKNPQKAKKPYENNTIRFNISENTIDISSSYLQKCTILYF